MTAEITRSLVSGTVTVPFSKSEAHRALICASLAEGSSEIASVPENKDIEATVSCLKEFGIDILPLENGLRVNSVGIMNIKPSGRFLNCSESGTTARLLTGIASVAAGKTVLDGAAVLRKRPMAGLFSALRSLGAKIREKGKTGYLPVEINGKMLSGGHLRIDASASSQFASALLLVGPCLDKGLSLEILNLKSAPYLKLTVAVMQAFGISVSVSGNTYSVKSQRYLPCSFSVAGDYSQASYFMAAAALTGGEVTVKGLSRNTFQGDKVFIELLKKMGCTCRQTDDYVYVKGPSVLKGIDVNMSDCPDLVPSLAVLAGNSRGKIRICGVSHIRGKESDRIVSITENLRRMGLTVKAGQDGLTVFPGRLKGAEIDSRNDHRIAMAFSVAGLCAEGKTIIRRFESVDKSFPGFLAEIKRINAGIRIL